ncbi:MAG: zinc ribbon domain-containing protein [Pseudomonadota bacterium]
METFERIQQRLKDCARVPARKDLNEDFPLRGFVTCADCGKPLTACWSKSSTGKKHPCYQCFNRGCPSARKSIRRDKIEGEFETILKSMTPSENLFQLIETMFRDAWDQRRKHLNHDTQLAKRKLAKIESQIDQLLERIVTTDTSSVIAAYEKEIATLESQKLIEEEKAAKMAKPVAPFDKMFELACSFLANPWNLGLLGNPHCRDWCSDWPSQSVCHTIGRRGFERRKCLNHLGFWRNSTKM